MEQDHSALETNDPNQDSVDEEIISELFGLLGHGDMSGLVRACDLFLNGVPTHLARARVAVAEGRLDDAGGAAHSLRGSAGVFGARRLSRLSDRLELCCRQGDATSAAGVVEDMQAEYVAFRPVLTLRLAALVTQPGPT